MEPHHAAGLGGVIFLLAVSGTVQAECLSVPAPNVPRAMRQSYAYALAYQSGYNIVPHAPDGLQVGQSALNEMCFDGLTQAQIQVFLSDQTMLDKHNAEETIRSQAKAQWDVLKAELDTIESQLESDDTNWTTLTTAQRLSVMKKVLRREVLKQKLGE